MDEDEWPLPLKAFRTTFLYTSLGLDLSGPFPVPRRPTSNFLAFGLGYPGIAVP